MSRLESGGVESVLLNYLGHFTHPEDFDIHIVTQDINDERCLQTFREAGYNIDVVTHKKKSILKNVVEVRRLLRRERFDVVHSHMTLMNFYVLFLASLTGSRLRISHSHNAFRSSNLLKLAFWSALKPLNKWFANQWFACGREAGIFLFGKHAVDSGKVTILPNAIDLGKFEYNPIARASIRKEFGIGEKDFVVGHVGRFMDQKNHKYLIDIFSSLVEKRPDSWLILVGTGELEKQIQDYVAECGLMDRVIFVGSVDNVNDYYQAMDVFALPSKFEGLPVVSIEAQAADLPVLISANVDCSCALTDNVKFTSVDLAPSVWADELLGMAGRSRGTEVQKRLQKAGYDIQTEAGRLEALYRNAGER
ncbi:glycosyltransferase family 1 protein [Pseudoscardovia suis]|uniref:glycosyltransferase family 1 protein n=1 Tax=Pseudoscardovia suis TaxID=987063 RepID=UPI003F94D6A4